VQEPAGSSSSNLVPANLGVETHLLNFAVGNSLLCKYIANMRNLLCFLLLALLGLVQAISSAGDRLLVVLEDESKKSSFSHFWGDLEGAKSICDGCSTQLLIRSNSSRFQDNIRVSKERKAIVV
jgi:hypothetical protein